MALRAISIEAEPAATNLVTNGGFETDTTGWAAQGAGAVISSEAVADAPFGARVLRITGATSTNARAVDSASIPNPAQGVVYTAQARIRAANAGAVGLVGLVQLEEQGGAQGNQSTLTPVTLTAEWQYATVTRTVAQADRTVLAVYVGVFDAAVVGTDQIEVDGVQAELGPVATPYIETNGGTASRTATTVRGSLNGSRGNIR